MTDRSGRDVQYVLVQDSKPKKSTRYYYDADDDNDSQQTVTTRKVIRPKPAKEQRVKYITTDEHDSDYRRPRIVEPSDRGIKIRNATDGEQVVLDEDNNVIKIIRHTRPSTPPYYENRRVKVGPREPQALYYETSDGHLVGRSTTNHTSTRTNKEFVYAEDEPTKVIRKVIIDPRTGNQQIIYEKDKPKKQIQQKIVVRKPVDEIPIDSDNEYDQEPQYVQVVRRPAVPKQEAPTSKYMMIRKKVDSEPIYAVDSALPTPKTNRIVYESPTKKASTSYVYSMGGKYYK